MPLRGGGAKGLQLRRQLLRRDNREPGAVGQGLRQALAGPAEPGPQHRAILVVEVELVTLVR